MWEGLYSDKRVAIKALRVYKDDDVKKVRKVIYLVFVISWWLKLTVAARSSVRRWRCGGGFPILTSSRSLEFLRHLRPSAWYPSGCQTGMCETMLGKIRTLVDCNW